MAQAKTELPRSSVRKLVVTYDGSTKLPTFVFEGVWTGFEISTVSSNLRREYLKTKRDQRRAVSSETVVTSTKGESE